MSTADSNSETPDATTTSGSAWLDLHLRPFSRQAGLSKPFAHTGFVMQASALRDRITEPGAVTVLRGEPGIGRHALLDHVAKELGGGVNWHRLHIKAEDGLAQALGRRFPQASRPESEWARLVGGDDVDPNPSVVVVEDAHRLTPDDLAKLMRLLEDQARLASLVLVAEPSIERQLAALGSDAAARIHTLSVLPLRRNQLPEYIAHRLRAAGIRSRSPLGEPELRRIYRETGGVPGRVNEAARTVLEEIYERDQEDNGYGQVPGNPASTALLITGALLLITGGAWLWTQMDGGESPRPELVADTRARAEPTASRPAAAARQDAIPTPPPADLAPATSPTPSKARNPAAPPGDQTRVAAEPARSTPAQQVVSPVTPAAPPPAPEPEPAPAPTPAPTPAPSGLRGPDWLMAQSAQGYTLQVVAVRDFAAVERLCEIPDACARAAWFSEQRDETTWYRVVVGAYPSRAEALAAVEELPSGLRDQTPWVRPLRDVQRAIARGSPPPNTGN